MADNSARIWFALFVLAVFCLGAGGGFILGRHLPPFPDSPGSPPFADGRQPVREGRGAIPPGPPFGPRRGGPGGPVGIPPGEAARLADDLQLDAAQRAQFRKVLEDHRLKFEEVHRQARERFDGEQRELHAAIRALLRPDQIQRFDAFINGRRP